MLVISIPIAYLSLLPSDMQNFLQSLIGVSIFASNILFWSESGYFEDSTELNPLIHTWSLALEEQYYLLFPLFLIFSWKFTKRWIISSLALLFITSFALAEWGSYNSPVATFYLLPTRGWELLMGAFAAFYLKSDDCKKFHKSISEFCGWFGITLILYSVFAYNNATPFPGIYGLVPTLGTLFIILFVTPNTIIGKFIGNKVFVGLGLISYSAYLWHQPLFAFARNRNLLEPNEGIFFILSILSFLLAYLSWRFVEIPFREKSFIQGRNIFYFSLGGSMLFILVGSLGILSYKNHFERIDNPHAFDPSLLIGPNYGLSKDCDTEYNDSKNCSTSNEPEILLWGDSYAMHLAQGFIASNSKIRLVQKTLSVCSPFFGISPINYNFVRWRAEKCLINNQKIFNYLKEQKTIKYVVLGSPFSQIVNSDAAVLTKEGIIVDGKDVAVMEMRDTLNTIKALGKIPIVFSPTPQNGKDIGKCLVKAIFFKQNRDICNVSHSDSIRYQNEVWSFLDEISSDAKVIYLDDFLCRDNTCLTYLDDILLYRDAGHLSHEGSAYLGKMMNFYGILTDAQ